jgi:hypothetical protein
MVVIFLYVIIISILSYFLIEKKAEIKNATIFILTAFVFGFDVSFYDKHILIGINDTSIINEIGRILLYHFIFGFIMIYTHLILFVAYKFIFSNIEIKLIKEYKTLLIKYINNKTEDINFIKDSTSYSSLLEESITDFSKTVSLATHIIIYFTWLIILLFSHFYQ